MFKSIRFKIVALFVALTMIMLMVMAITLQFSFNSLYSNVEGDEFFTHELATLTSYIYNNLLITMLFAVIFSVLLAFFLSRSIAKPIKRLTDKAKEIASGDYETKIPVTTRDEIGELSKSFNNMTSVITANIQQISSEKSKLEKMLMHMTDGVIAFNLNGDVIHINANAKKMLNIKDDENIYFDEFFEHLKAHISIAELIYLENESTLTREIDLGETILNFYFSSFKDEQNKLSGIITVIHDITESERIDKLRHEFVANVSHELRTPLTTIKGYAETMQTDKSQPKEHRKYFQVIIDETDRMTNIVKDLLTLTTLGSPSLLENREYFSLDDMIKNTISKFANQVEKNGQKISYSATTEIPQIYANKGKIEQVLVNVIANAIKYSPKDKGKIEVFAGNVYNNVYVKVSDNGIGIPEKDL
ncbi:MAG: cell wall metabolism sensor histidine kinase WalK, partial [Oscillospiraceae bacterium]|nr:cell wall metabolism sensor histidine kinase WalK [Oscillospiraceae bacterium]